jgi:hypothetical protein
MAPHAAVHSSPSSFAFSACPERSRRASSACSALNAFLRSSHFQFSIFHFRRKPSASPISTRPVHNSFLSPTYAKTGGYPLPQNVGAPTFSIFPLIFCSFLHSTHGTWQEGWPRKFVRGGEGAHKSQRYMRAGRRHKKRDNAEAQRAQRSADKRKAAADQGFVAGLVPGLVISFSASARAWAAGISAPDLST